VPKLESGSVYRNGRWIYLNTHCCGPGCSKWLPADKREAGYCTVRCRKAAEAEAAGEARSLEAAESGAGLEKLYDAEYHRSYPDE
jgi:hypothetical protein